MKRTDAMNAVIDYLLDGNNIDNVCGACVYYEEIALTPEHPDCRRCKHFEKSSNVACREGLIKYFEKQ